MHSSRVAAQLDANPGFPANAVASSSLYVELLWSWG